jgi:hypothetical protein
MAEYILENINISTLSVYDLLKHTAESSFVGIRDFHEIYPVPLKTIQAFLQRNLHFRIFRWSP